MNRRNCVLRLIAMSLGLIWVPTLAQGQPWDGPKIVSTYTSAVVYISGEAKLTTGGSRSWTGTGFIVHEKGFVLTNSHMVPESSEHVSRRIAGTVGRKPQNAFDGMVLEVIKRDAQLDLALLKLPEQPVPWKPAVQMGDSNKVSVGQRLFVLGFPLGENLSFVDGVLSSVNAPQGRFQTSVLLHPGTSGGPVFDDRGDVVALVVGGIPGAPGINFLIPINYARGLLKLLGPPW